MLYNKNTLLTTIQRFDVFITKQIALLFYVDLSAQDHERTSRYSTTLNFQDGCHLLVCNFVDKCYFNENSALKQSDFQKCFLRNRCNVCGVLLSESFVNCIIVVCYNDINVCRHGHIYFLVFYSDNLSVCAYYG